MANSLARNIVRTFSTQVGSQLLAILTGIVIARTIGPSGKGYMSYAATGVSFVSVFLYGFTDAVLYQFGKLGHSARAVHDVASRILMGLLAIVVPAFIAIAAFFPSQRPLALAAAALPFAMYIQMMTPFLMVRGNILLLNIRALAQSLGTAIVTVPMLLYFHLGLQAALAVWIFFYAVAALQSAWAMHSILAADSNPVEPSQTLFHEQLHFGLRAAGGSTAGFLNMRISILLVSILFTPAALGWYTLAIGTGELLWQVSRAFIWSALGRIGSDSLLDSANLVARLTRNTFAIVGGLGVLAFFVGPWIIVKVYGESFAPAGNALRWALPGLIAYASEVSLTKFIILQLGRPMTTIWVQSGATMLCAILTLISANRFGILGAAASTSFTYLIVTAVLMRIFHRGTGIPPQRLLFVQREDLQHYITIGEGMLRTLRLRST